MGRLGKKKTTVVGVWASLFAFLILFLRVRMYVTLLTMISVMCVRGDEQSFGTTKECSLHSYQIDGWMNGWILQNLQMPKNGKGWNRNWTPVWSLFLMCFFFYAKVKTKKCICLCFCPVVLEKRRGLHQKPCRHEDSPVLFLSIFPFSSEFKHSSCPTTSSFVKELHRCWYD